MLKFKSLISKIAIISMLCLVASFSFIAVNKKSHNTNALNLVVENIVSNNSSNDGALLLNYANETETELLTDTYGTNNNVQALASGVKNKGSDYYTISISSDLYPNPIKGGTTISYAGSSQTAAINGINYFNQAQITFTGNTNGSATFTANAGYAIVGFAFGYGEGKTYAENMTIKWTHYSSISSTTEDIKNKPEGNLILLTSPFTPETIIKDYSNQYLAFKALVIEIPYTLDLYYSYDEITYSKYTIEGCDYSLIFKKETSSDLPDSTEAEKEFKNNKNKPEYLSFGRWMINADVTYSGDLYTKYTYDDEDPDKFQVEQYTGEEDDNTKKTECLLTFTGITKNPYNNYYYAEKVSGYGMLYQSDTAPIITAKWSTIYDLTIDIKNSPKSGEDATQIDKTNKTDAHLAGVYSHKNNNTNQQNTSTTLQIQDNAACSYPFASSEFENSDKSVTGLSFMDSSNITSYKWQSEYSSNWYTLFNYGYYIAGYQFVYGFTSTDGNNYESGTVIKFEGGIWKPVNEAFSYKDTDQITSIDKLIGISGKIDNTLSGLACFAETVDEMSGTQIVKNIAMFPVWAPVNITVAANCEETNSSSSTSFVYNEKQYSLTLVGAPAGQSLMCYQYVKDDDNTLIATAGDWNYLNIPYNTATDGTNGYTYTKIDDEVEVGQGTYTLNVEAVFVDNIYRVDLTGVIPTANNQYDLVSGDYTFDNSSMFSENECTFATLEKDDNNTDDNVYEYKWTPYVNDNGNGSIDDYITKTLISLKNKYIDIVTNANHKIFRKVFVSGGSVTPSDVNTTYTTLMWIYLANGQNTGNLPVFERDYFALILWDNAYETSETDALQYTYKTNEYNSGLHLSEIANLDESGNVIDYKYNLHQGSSGNIENIWYYADGKKDNNEFDTLNAHYYRKNYQLDINTLVETEGLGQFGYVKVDIDDIIFEDGNKECVSGSYVIIYNNGMKCYNADDVLISGSLSKSKLKTATALTELKLYEGCNLTISVVDQSRDETAMISADFDNMIGFKFANATSNGSPVFIGINNVGHEFDTDSYTFEFLSADIANLNYKNGSTIKLDVYFTPIEYNFTIKIDNNLAGKFNVAQSGTKTPYTTEYTLENLTVLGMHKINISAFINAGYSLQENAYILNNGVVLHNYYNNESGVSSQDYYIGVLGENYYFYGTWLRNYFYQNRNYAVDNTEETITLQTETIVFNYDLKLYDGAFTTIELFKVENGEFILDENGDKIPSTRQLNKDTGTTTVKVSSLTSVEYDDEIKSWVYNYNGTKYAILSSRMYFPKNPTTTKDNHYTTYAFLLENEPNTAFAINSNMLTRMVTSYSEGVIIPYNIRQIYLMLEVREIVEIAISAVDTFDSITGKSIDTNSTTRIATITNGTNNSGSLTLNSGSLFDETVIVYSYKGAENTISYNCDTKRYDGIFYKLGETGSEINYADNNSFTINENVNVVVRFNPKPLQAEVVYKIGDDFVSRDAMSDYMKDEVLPEAIPGEYYIMYNLHYEVVANHNDYDLKVSVNGRSTPNEGETYTTVNTERKVSFTYVVGDIDYNYEKIQIVVELVEIDNSLITIQFILNDKTKLTSYDNYGHITVKDEYSTLATSIDNTDVGADGLDYTEYLTFKAVKDRDITVTLDLFEGYHFVTYKHNAFNAFENVTYVDNSFTLVENFNPDQDYGYYYVIIDKYLVDVKLDTTDLLGNYTINGEKELYDMYTGLNLHMSSDIVDGERFVNFYYLSKVELDNRYKGNDLSYADYRFTDGSLNKIYLEDSDVLITSEMLEKANLAGYTSDGSVIYFGVEVVKQFKLDYEIIGAEYAKTISITSNNDTYVSGTYLDVGTEINLLVETLVEGKYGIKITDKVVNKEIIVDKLDDVLALTKNENLIIEIYPKSYGLIIDENIYKTLEDLENGPQDVPVNEYVNALTRSGQRYNESSMISLVRLTNDRELGEMIITDENATYMVVFYGTEYETYIVNEDKTLSEVNLDEIGYVVSLSNDRVRIDYITKCELALTLNYKEYKIITTN